MPPKAPKARKRKHDDDEVDFEDVTPDVNAVDVMDMGDAAGSGVSEVLHVPARPVRRLPPLVASERSRDNDEGDADTGDNVTRDTTADPLADLLSHLSLFEDELLRLEAGPTPGALCSVCGSGIAETRCTECVPRGFLCRACQVEAHILSPLHWIEVWNGDCFERKGLSALGLIMKLPHDPVTCTSLSTPISFTIVHTSGIHNVRMAHCQCTNGPGMLSLLMRNRLFPSTTRAPRSAFSFAVLRDFHLDTLVSKKSAYDFCGKLTRLTNNILPMETRDRYREFLRVARVWRHLQGSKRSGQLHDLHQYFPSFVREVGPRCVRCPACPLPGVNVTVERLNELFASGALHLCTQIIGGDGNFHLQLKARQKDGHTVSLCEGDGLFPPSEEYRKYIEKYTDSREAHLTCSGLPSGMVHRDGRDQGMSVAGWFSWFCGRHSMFKPRGVVDLQKGEKYANVDYGLAYALMGCEGVPRTVASYDLACRYSIHVAERMAERFPDIDTSTITWVVPKMHSGGHNKQCQYEYGLGFCVGVGRTDGEGVERPWSELNQLSGSTREMGAGYRHDVIEDNGGDWNFRKMRDMPIHIVKKYKEAVHYADLHSSEFNMQCEALPSELVVKWGAMDPKPVKGPRGKITSVYMLPEGLVPSRKEIVDELAKKEQEANEDRRYDNSSSKTAFIDLGITIEEKQYTIANRIQGTHKDRDGLKHVQQWRKDLIEDLRRYHELQSQHATSIATSGYEGSEAPEEEPLNLPSSYASEASRKRLRLEDLAVIELDIRKGLALDALQELALAIQRKQVLQTQKKANVHGQAAQTRSARVLTSCQNEIDRYAERYRRNLSAMHNLGLPPTDSTFKALNTSDLRAPALNQSQYVLGDGRSVGPWFFSLACTFAGKEGTHEETLNEAVGRVNWWRAKASSERWTEEKELLREEMKRTVGFYQFYADAWGKCVAQEDVGTPLGQGRRAYASKQKRMFEKLRQNGEDLFTEIVQQYENGQELLRDIVQQ